MNCDTDTGQMSSFIKYFSSDCNGDNASMPTVRDINRMPSQGVGMSHIAAAAATTAALAAAAIADDDDEDDEEDDEDDGTAATLTAACVAAATCGYTPK
jgi:hypothetical protein